MINEAKLKHIIGEELSAVSRKHFASQGDVDRVIQRVKECIVEKARRKEKEDNSFVPGVGYDEKKDYKRLNKQMIAVFRVMLSGEWMTQQEISERSGACITSLRARFSDLRSKRWGGHQVLTERVKDGSGTWKYRLIPNKESMTYQDFIQSRNEFTNAS